MTIPVTLYITDFTIAASPVSLTLSPGSSATTSVLLTPLYGFTGSASLSVTSGLPAGMTAGFALTSVSAGSPSTLTISASSAVPQTYYTLTVSGVANGVTHSTTVTVKVTIPQVTVKIGDLLDVYVGYPVTSAATASVDPLPGGYTASQLVATWSYSKEYIVHSYTGTDDFWSDPNDGSTAAVPLNGASTSPDGTFTGTFNTTGYYEVCMSATVSFHNPTTGGNFGPYTGYGFAGNPVNSAPATKTFVASNSASPNGTTGGAPPPSVSNRKFVVSSGYKITSAQIEDSYYKDAAGTRQKHPRKADGSIQTDTVAQLSLGYSQWIGVCQFAVSPGLLSNYSWGQMAETTLS